MLDTPAHRSFFHRNNFVHPTSPSFPKVAISLSDKSLHTLLSDIPSSLSLWQKGAFESEQYRDRAKIRIAGDSNPNNYLYKLKAFKVKLKKGSNFFTQRRFTLLPRTTTELYRQVFSFLLADSLGLVAPMVLPVQLELNGRSLGTYLLREDLGEEFLRSRNILPGEIYKADRAPTLDFAKDTDFPAEYFGATTNWEKIGRNNRLAEDNWEPLRQGLLKLWHNTPAIDSISYTNQRVQHDYLWNKETWARYAVYEFLVNGSHQDYRHNQRLLYDDQLGQIIPIVWDPSIFPDPHPQSSIFPFQHPVTSNLINDPRFRATYFRELSSIAKNLASRGCIFGWACLASDNKTKDVTPVRLDQVNHINEVRSWLRVALPPSYIDHEINRIKRSIDRLIEEERLNSVEFHNFSNCIELRSTRLSGFNRLDLVANGVVVESLSGNLISESLFPRAIGNYCGYVPNFPQCLLQLSPRYMQPGQLWLEPQKFEIDRIDLYPTFGHPFSISPEPRTPLESCPANRHTFFDLQNAIAHFPEMTISGVVEFNETLVFNQHVNILPGTDLLLGPSTSLIFRGGVTAVGTTEEPISIRPLHENKNTPWGVFAIVGSESEGSVVDNVEFIGGSTASVEKINFLGMVSIHNTKNITVRSSIIRDNHIGDDALHAVYTSNLRLEKLTFSGIRADAADIDLSTDVRISDFVVKDAGNDCLDFMGTYAEIHSIRLSRCGDKGISVGERSMVRLWRGEISRSTTGVASKDESYFFHRNLAFQDNEEDVMEYSKNDKYRSAGAVVTWTDPELTIMETNSNGSCGHASILARQNDSSAHLLWHPPHSFESSLDCDH